MKITNEIKKQKAIELMNKLNIYKPYIRGFENDNMVCFFENFGGFLNPLNITITAAVL